MNKSLLGLIRTCFLFGSRVLPKATGRVAFRLFCTTFEPSRKSAQHKAILVAAEVQFEKATHHSIVYSGGTIAAFEFMPDSSHDESETVWLVHGWQSHSLFMGQFVQPFLEQGYRVVCIDLPGHGRSSGRTFHLPLAVDALHAVQAQLGSFSVIVSHSLGGAVVATTLAGTLPNYPAIPVEKLVLVSSPDAMEKIFDNFASMIGLGDISRQELHAMVTRLSGKLTSDFSTGLQLKPLSAEMLLIHAPDDKEVPFSESEAIALANEGSTLLPMPGLGHRRIIASADVVKSTIAFVTQ